MSVVCVQAGLKVKKAREIYKSYVEKYASTKTEFEQKMEDTAQVCMVAQLCIYGFPPTNGLNLVSSPLTCYPCVC